MDDIGWRPARLHAVVEEHDFAGVEGAANGHGDGLAKVEANLAEDLGGVAGLVAVDGDDDVAGAEADDLVLIQAVRNVQRFRLRGRRTLNDGSDLGEADVHVAGDHEDDGEKEDGEDEVHAGAGGEDEKADPAGLSGEAVGVGGVLFAEEAHEAAEREPVDGVDGVAPGEAPRAGRVSEAGLQDLDSGELGREVVAELVDDDEDDEDTGEGENGVSDDVHDSRLPKSWP